MGILKRPKSIVTEESTQKQHSGGDHDGDIGDRSSGEEWDTKAEEEEQQQKTKEAKKNKKVKKKRKDKKSEIAEPAYIIAQIKNNIASQKHIEGDDDEMESVKKTKSKQQQQQSDGMRFLRTDTDAVDIGKFDDDDDDNDVISDDDDVINEQRMNIREAFANDDVIEDFIQEKETVLEQSKPRTVDMTLPGWGEWGGAGLKVSEKKRKRFTKGADTGPQKKRRDDGKDNVIISEARNKNLVKHQVRKMHSLLTCLDIFLSKIVCNVGF